jgi:hypothetical protein
MSTTAAVWIPLALVALVAARALIDKLTSSGLDADSINLFLRRVDLRILENLLDPAEEARLRTELSTRAFRRLQRQRILGACEQIRRVSNNASVLLQWANGEYAGIAHKSRAQFDANDSLLVSVIQAATEVKSGAWWALLKLRFWRASLVQLWPFLPSPSLSDLREVYGKDLLQSYEALTSSAGELLIGRGGDLYDQARAAL